MTDGTSRLPLAGITVVAVEQAVAAPLCTARLADAGARVIKIERPGGDFARGYDQTAGGDSSYFMWANHGKESVVLDLKDSNDADLLDRLIAAADVFVQNLSPGALDRLGFATDTLRERHPSLITMDISGYGDAPQVAKKRAYDLLVQAESAVIAVSGGPNELGRVGISICDIGTGITAYGAILEALVGRSVSGQGESLAVSLFDVAAEWMTVPFVQHGAGLPPQRVGLAHPSIAPYGAYKTDDDQLTLISIQNEREWARLCDDVLALPQLTADERFASNQRRVSNRAALEQELSQAIGEIDAATFRHRLDLAAIAWGAVNDLDALAQHPALRTRQATSSQGTQVLMPAHPVRSPNRALANDEPVDKSAAVPKVGEHTEAIRAEFGPETEREPSPRL